ncbi:hypothetical protein ERE_35840 [Agathobacter rectalis M104/1]|nr:hypothetical protein ERE_35840 [Agathobacter rectalis M104/1]
MKIHIYCSHKQNNINEKKIMTIKQLLEILNKRITAGFGCVKVERMENKTFSSLIGFSFTKDPNEAAFAFRTDTGLEMLNTINKGE